MVAALGELRFLEGYFLSIYEAHRVSSLPPKEEELSRFAGGISEDVARIAHRVNEELSKWRQG
jgi:ribosomal protein L10